MRLLTVDDENHTLHYILSFDWSFPKIWRFCNQEYDLGIPISGETPKTPNLRVFFELGQNSSLPNACLTSQAQYTTEHPIRI